MTPPEAPQSPRPASPGMIDPRGRTVHAAIDEPAGDAQVASGALRVAGWVCDESGPLRSAALLAGDGEATRVRLGLWRPDIGEAFPDAPHASASGFEGFVDLRSARAGGVRIALLAETGAGWEEAAAVEVRSALPIPSPEAARPRAAFTIVQNEPTMLPLWLGYYGRYFDPDDLYVIDHDSGDGSTARLGGRCHVVRAHRDVSFDQRWLRSVVENFQAFLLRSYTTVLFSAVDEFIVADPKEHAGLDAYMNELAPPAVRCAGFSVVHQPGEQPLRFDAPVLSQRRYWHASGRYSKRLLSRVPLRWSEGFHDEYNAPDRPPDPTLLLIHLHRVDYDACLARHRSTAARDWTEADIIRGHGAQNRIADPDGFDEWFRHGPDLDAPRELIPEHIRSVF